MTDLHAQLAIIGGGTGGVAAALIATALGQRVILTCDTPWLGGQLTAQLVPPDESLWVETLGGTARYRRYRELVRRYYRDHYPLTPAARANALLNPGNCAITPLGHEPRVGVAVLDQLLAPALARGLLTILRPVEPVAAHVASDRVGAVHCRDLVTGAEYTLTADYFLDATDLGDLLPLAGAEYVTGAEARSETGEPHALDRAEPGRVQAYTWCAALGYDRTPGAAHTSPRPARYEHCRAWRYESLTDLTGPRLSLTHPTRDGRGQPFALLPEEFRPGTGTPFPLWIYRRVLAAEHFPPDQQPEELTLVNWPMNDYLEGNLIDVPPAERAHHREEARQLTLSLVHWLQTEAPRPAGGTGYPGLRLRPDAAGTPDGLAQAPYIRESRRLRTVFTVTENHVGVCARTGCGGDHRAPTAEERARLFAQRACAEQFADSVGTGFYGIDIHYHAGGAAGLSLNVFPNQIPLGALLPVRLRNLLPAAKNLGVTHLTNGCYRLHPTEWNIGEAAGALAAYCLAHACAPHAVRATPHHLAAYQALLRDQGFTLQWPEETRPMHDPAFLTALRQAGHAIDHPRYYV